MDSDSDDIPLAQRVPQPKPVPRADPPPRKPEPSTKRKAVAPPAVAADKRAKGAPAPKPRRAAARGDDDEDEDEEDDSSSDEEDDDDDDAATAAGKATKRLAKDRKAVAQMSRVKKGVRCVRAFGLWPRRTCTALSPLRRA